MREDIFKELIKYILERMAEDMSERILKDM